MSWHRTVLASLIALTIRMLCRIINCLDMKKEKLILSSIAVLFGLLVAGVAFYFFQMPKASPSSTIKNKTITLATPSPTPSTALFLNVIEPRDEDVVDNKTLVISGKTQNNAIVVIITGSSEDVITPSANGEFSTAIALDSGENMLEVTAIAANGESITDKRVVTYSQEEF